jgi:hypothetical protein
MSSKIEDLVLTGKSGTKYTFEMYPLDTSFRVVGGVYIITKRTVVSAGGSHSLIYVGHTGNLSERFDDHHKADCFKRHGANCIGVLLEENEQRRLAIEADLLKAYDWPCNG